MSQRKSRRGLPNRSPRRLALFHAARLRPSTAAVGPWSLGAMIGLGFPTERRLTYGYHEPVLARRRCADPLRSAQWLRERSLANTEKGDMARGTSNAAAVDRDFKSCSPPAW